MTASRTQSPTLYLLTLVAETHLGGVAAAIVSALILHGRLTAGELGHRCRLAAKTVKRALVLLIQLGCVQYWRDAATAGGGSGGSGGSGRVHYFLNPRGLLTFVHSGDIIAHIHATYGAELAQITQNVLEVGHVRIDHLVAPFDGAARVAQQDRLVRLVADGWLERLQPLHYSPLDELWAQQYAETLRLLPRLSTTSEVKRVAEAKELTRAKLDKLLRAGTEPADLYTHDAGRKLVRAELVVRFNLARFERALRTRALVNLARSRVGAVSAKVYQCALAATEAKLPDLSPPVLRIGGLVADPEEAQRVVNLLENKLVEQRQTTFQARDLVRLCDARLDLRHSILPAGFGKPKRVAVAPETANKRIKTEEAEMVAAAAIELDFSPDANDDPHLVLLLTHHLRLLALLAVSFLTEVSPGTFTVPYSALAEPLKLLTFDSLIKATLGPASFKILRCLRQLRLADEKTIANTVLLKEKAVRNELCKLVNVNALEVQEIPRSADRAAAKTFFLFRHRAYMLYQFLANELLFNMAEMLSGIAAYKQDHRILLDKCEREDVRGHEEELLLDSELKTLRDLQAREVSSMAKFNRLKGLHDVFGVL